MTEQRREPSNSVDIWELLDRSVTKVTPTGEKPEKPAKSEEEKEKQRRTWRRWRRAADAISVAVWFYAVTKLFVFDIDRALVDAIAPSYTWLVGYRALILAAFLVLAALFMWRRMTLLLLLYVLLFPWIVIVWKLPRALYRRRSWLGVMAVINAIAVVLRNMRYTLITKGLALIAMVVILGGDATIPLIVSGIYIGLLLLWSSIRTVRRTVEPDWFLKAHGSAIDRVVASKAVASFTSLSDDIKSGQVEVLNSTQVATVTNALSVSMVLNRALYFWAYQLQQYKQARLSVFFNAITYAWLFIGAMLAFWLMNLALLKVDPGQYVYTVQPSEIAVLLYSLVSLALNEGGGLSAQGDIAILLRIFAGLYGPLFLAVFLFNVLFAWRQQRDSDSLANTVEGLKERAREQESRLRAEYDVGVEEARRRLEQLGQGLYWFVGWLTSSIPAEFLDDDDSS